MAPLLLRSPQISSSTTPSPTPPSQNDWLTSQQSQPQEPSTNALSLNSILALIAGILLALFLAAIIFSIARKRQRQLRPPQPKSMAQMSFFEKLAFDQRDMGSSGRRDTWRRDTFLYAMPTGQEKQRKVMDEPEKVWVITPMAPVVVRTQ